MTVASNQQEPSMEEILSSIRRIIADEQDESEGDKTDVAEHADESAISTPVDEPPEFQQVATHDDEDEDEDDIFDLTDVVSEVAPPEPDEEPDDGLFDAVEPAVEDLAAADEPLTSEAENLSEPDWDDEDDDEIELAPIAEPEPEAIMPEPEPNLTHEIMPEPVPEPTSISSVETQTVTQQVEDTIISDVTASSSAGALAKLAKVAAGERQSQIEGGDKSVEVFMAELVRPMLKDWLDTNLNTIVERVVEQEVKKLVRRAELM